MIIKEIKQYKPLIGSMSCVGISKNARYPLSFGNYMSIRNGPSIINMWAENLQEWHRQYGYSYIEVTEFSDSKSKLGIITDTRAKDWINNKLCVTGCGWGSRELCESIHQFLNLPITNEICGCERSTQSPRISQIIKFIDNSRKTTYFCNYCQRNWSS